MISSKRYAKAAVVALAAGLFGLLGACETTGSGGDTPVGVGSGSPSFLYKPSQQAKPAPKAEHKPAVKVPAEPAPKSVVRSGGCGAAPEVGPGMTVVGLPFPTGDRATSALMLYQVMPAEVRRGAEFGYKYYVTNVTQGTLQNVAVVLENTSNLDVVSANPQPMTGQGGTVWSLGELGPCETRMIDVRATADATGSAGNCVSVSYNNSLCAVTNVVDPDLAIKKTVTPKVLKCDPITITYNVCNPGTGVAAGVVVRDTLPAGLTVNGSRNIEIPVGDLAAGDCRDVSVTAMAANTGEYCSAASASSSGGLSAKSGEPCTTVVAPDLEITCSARDTQYINRNAEYQFEVTNKGDGVAKNVVANITLPAGAEFVSASSGAVPSQGAVAFQMGDLNAGQSRNVSVTLRSRVAGTIRTSATATGACSDPATTSCQTEYRGIPAILLEVVDLVDPVEVGQQTTYRITVTNQGSAPDTNIVVKCVLPAEESFVSVSGATGSRTSGQEITFSPVASLAPGAQASWDLVVKATGEADVRFAVEMTSDNFSKPVRETESTNLYE